MSSRSDLHTASHKTEVAGAKRRQLEQPVACDHRREAFHVPPLTSAPSCRQRTKRETANLVGGHTVNRIQVMESFAVVLFLTLGFYYMASSCI